MIQLRNNQIKIVEDVLNYINQGSNSVLIISPTASGKTIVACCLIGALQCQSTIFLVTNQEAKNQTLNVLNKFGLTNVEVNTIQSRLDNKQADLVVIDECHHYLLQNSWGQEVLNLQPKLIIGLTATPFRTDQKPLLSINGGLFTNVVNGPDIKNLMNDGFVANIDYYTVPLTQKIERYPIWYRGEISHYVEAQITEPDDQSTTDKSILEEYNKFKLPAIIFCKSIHHTEYVANLFSKNNVEARAIHSYVSKYNRRLIIDKFNKNKLPIITVCNAINESFDSYNAKMGIFLCVIKQSITKYIQSVGRISRPKNGEHSVLLDLVGNVYHYGRVEDINIAAR